MMKNIFTILMIMLVSAPDASAQEITPRPNHYETQAGTVNLPRTITITADNEFDDLIPDFVETAQKFSIRTQTKKKNGFIRLTKNKALNNPEEYRIRIAPTGILIEAGSPNGCFYGLQSTLQLIISAGKEGTLPLAVIQDKPRFGWRGVMVDESRHFIGKAEIMRLLDFMAIYKLNKFHWHLTDSQGWRIEIKKYPLLTTVGAIGNISDPEASAQFYTQEDIAEIVKYASDRFIEIIPEIDMPGHATAAVKAYPEFSGGGSEEYPHFTFHPGKEGTYTFLTDILREITTLFPSSFIHIGGDEVHFGNKQWHDMPQVRSLMEKEGLEDLVAVEHYFLQRMADSVKVLGKTVIGWDEVVTAGLPANNTRVMWWRHDQPQLLEKAVTMGYGTILCPRIPLYFDFVQHASHTSGRKWDGAFAPIESVYEFPSLRLTGGVSFCSPHVMGIQANVWTEVIHSKERFQFMVFPRIAALAEAAWSNDAVKDFRHFDRRMEKMTDLYRKSGIAFFDYRNPGVSPEIMGPEK